jgi:prepilin-type N-terminal cleavage/methylation domain-containing protein
MIIVKKGFTLIELLIVVAIIAILAAIAVPNFLEAQVRAKVSRARADLRTLATAIEAYAVDNNRPPREYDSDPAVDGPFFGQVDASGIMSPVLSTPVAYVTNAYFLDPFVRPGDLIPSDEKYFTYANALERKQIHEETNANVWFFGGPLTQAQRSEAIIANYGNWYALSIGPDRSYFNNSVGLGRAGIVGREYIPYDPTNGTVSFGNVIRSQARSENFIPPVSPVTILGPH